MNASALDGAPPDSSRVGLEFSTYGTVSRGVGLGGHGHKTQDTVYVELR